MWGCTKHIPSLPHNRKIQGVCAAQDTACGLYMFHSCPLFHSTGKHILINYNLNREKHSAPKVNGRCAQSKNKDMLRARLRRRILKYNQNRKCLPLQYKQRQPRFDSSPIFVVEKNKKKLKNAAMAWLRRSLDAIPRATSLVQNLATGHFTSQALHKNPSMSHGSEAAADPTQEDEREGLPGQGLSVCITPSFNVKIECISLCVSVSSFTYKSTNSEINSITSIYYIISYYKTYYKSKTD
jgi:hypothetical protein